jgi:hypothetical protein
MSLSDDDDDDDDDDDVRNTVYIVHMFIKRLSNFMQQSPS